MRKKLLAMLLAVVLAVGLLPVAAFAADSDFVIDEYGGLTGYNGPGGDVVIPSGVTYIGSGAFAGCDGLTGVTIPSGVTYIGEAAFLSCKNLACVTIPASVTTIMVSAFAECPLKDVYYGGSESQWGEIEYLQIFGPSIAFSDGGQEAANLGGATIHYNSTGPDTAELTEPTEPETPAGPEVIGSGSCGEAVDWTKTKDGVLTISGTGPMSDYDFEYSLAYVVPGTLNAVVIEDGVTYIGAYAFEYCYNLTSVTIPDSVTAIGRFAFDMCSNLTSVTIPDGVTAIEGYTFQSCSALTEITIPAGVTSIGEFAFSGCVSLTDVYYGGTENQWAEISIGNQNVALTNATIHYNSTGPDTAEPTEPTEPTEPETPKTSFTDLAEGAYYTDAVAWAVENKITTGYSDNYFGPDDTCTNVQILTFLYRAVQGGGAASSDDMAKAVSWAREKNMIDDSFVQDDYCTRSSAVMFIWQALGSTSPTKGSSFTDVPADAPYADAVAWAVENKVTTGYTANYFGPKDTCTRGQIVTFLHRAMCP